MLFDEYYKQYLIDKGHDVLHLKLPDNIIYPKFVIHYVNSSNKVCSHFESKNNLRTLRVKCRNETLQSILNHE
jgi:hypothetical protein